MTAIKVQDCGCIALPDEIVEQASLYPGSTLTIAVAPDGKTIELTPLTTTSRPENPPQGANCG
ncbi:MAG: hypothetical protein WA869_13350 [Alloacidobacterium sp.]